MSKNTLIIAAMDEFFEKWQNVKSQSGLPESEVDEDWPSPCEKEIAGTTYWQPVKQSLVNAEAVNFDNVGSALNIEINGQYSDYFSCYYSNNIDVEHEKGACQLLQAWSQDDFERLQQNLIGHLMMKQKLKQKPTLFFALTDQEDLNLVVDNESGQVCLEYVGKEPHEIIADDLVSFIKACKVI